MTLTLSTPRIAKCSASTPRSRLPTLALPSAPRRQPQDPPGHRRRRLRLALVPAGLRTTRTAVCSIMRRSGVKEREAPFDAIATMRSAPMRSRAAFKLCPSHPGPLDLRFGLLAARQRASRQLDPLGLPISSRWPSLRTACVRGSRSDPPRRASEACGAGMTGTRHYLRIVLPSLDSRPPRATDCRRVIFA